MLARSLYHRPRPLAFVLGALGLWAFGAWRIDASGELERARAQVFEQACQGLSPGSTLAEAQARLALRDPARDRLAELAGLSGETWFFAGQEVPAEWAASAQGSPALVAEYAFMRRYRLVPFNVPLFKVERRLCFVDADPAGRVSRAALSASGDVL